MGKSRLSFLVMDIVLLFAAIGYIFVVFELSGPIFIVHLALIIIFLLFLVVGMTAVHGNKTWGWSLIGAVLILLLLDILFVSFLTRKFNTEHIVAIIFSFVGLVIAALNIRISGKSESEIKDDYLKVDKYYPNIEKTEPKEEPKKEEEKKEIEIIKEEPKKEEAAIKAKKTATAKFIASKETKKYHTSRCGWSRITKRKNRVYFDSRKKAESKGFKPHECVV